MAMAFEIEDRQVDDDTHVVAVTGEIDLFTAPEFKQRVSAPIDAGRTRLVVDLTATTFIDSSSLGVLIGAHRRLRRLNGSLVIVCSPSCDSPTMPSASTTSSNGMISPTSSGSRRSLRPSSARSCERRARVKTC